MARNLLVEPNLAAKEKPVRWMVIIATAAVSGVLTAPAQAQYVGNMTLNPMMAPALAQLTGTFYNSLGSSANSPGLNDAPGVFDGNQNSIQLVPNNVSNPPGRYGNRLSPDSFYNPLGRNGGQFAPQGPDNPLGPNVQVYTPG